MKENSKVILLGVSFNDAFGVGVTLRNLFSQFPPDQVALVDFNVNKDDLHYSKSLFHLGKNQVLPLNQKGVDINKQATSSLKSPQNNTLVKLIRIIFLTLRKYLAYYYNHYTSIKITKELNDFISKFNASYIYVVPYNRRVVNFALQLSKVHGIPIVVHFMDDYRKRSPWDLLYFYNEYRHIRKIRKLVNSSYRCLAICESMADEYESVLGKPFLYFHNPINIDSFENVRIEKAFNEGIIRIAYTGTISENNFDTLAFFAEYCSHQKNSLRPIMLDIYAPNIITNLFYQRFSNNIKNNKYVELKDKLEHSQLIQALFNYDLLLLPLTFSQRYHHVIKVSFPTKVAEYMASGIPILFLIPEFVALHDFVTKFQFGYLVDKLETDKLNSLFDHLITEENINFRDLKARDLAIEKFDINKVASDFKKVFSA
jgi:hypothetical protein